MTASRRPQTVTYSDGPGRRASVMHAANPTRSMNRSASCGVSTCLAPSRCHRSSRYSSASGETCVRVISSLDRSYPTAIDRRMRTSGRFARFHIPAVGPTDVADGDHRCDHGPPTRDVLVEPVLRLAVHPTLHFLRFLDA